MLCLIHPRIAILILRTHDSGSRRSLARMRSSITNPGRLQRMSVKHSSRCAQTASTSILVTLPRPLTRAGWSQSRVLSRFFLLSTRQRWWYHHRCCFPPHQHVREDHHMRSNFSIPGPPRQSTGMMISLLSSLSALVCHGSHELVQLGPRFLHRILYTRATIQGILARDYSHRMDEMLETMLPLVVKGPSAPLRRLLPKEAFC